MFNRHTLATALTACSLVLAGGQGHATGTPPAPKAALPRPAAATPPLVCVAGIILTADGQPCAGVCVFPTTNPRLIAVTDAHGAFQLQVPAAPTLRLQAEYVGLSSVRVDVDGQHPQPVHIVLGR